VSSRRNDVDRTLTTSGNDELTPLRRRIRAVASRVDRDLPWSLTRDPWAIYVSEVMLQQTSVARVLEPWRRFCDLFPTPAACAEAPLGDVLRAWAGLGYPRRARNLQRAAQRMVSDFDGQVPSDVEQLRSLPGVGPYTAHAVAAFAFGRRVGVVDTNVGRILARCVTNSRLSAPRAQELSTQLVGRADPARMNQALLDLGAQFCRATPRCDSCPLRSECRWRREGGPDPAMESAGVSRPQARFEGSNRQARGRLLAQLQLGTCRKAVALNILAPDDLERASALLADLENEGLVSVERGRVRLGS